MEFDFEHPVGGARFDLFGIYTEGQLHRSEHTPVWARSDRCETDPLSSGGEAESSVKSARGPVPSSLDSHKGQYGIAISVSETVLHFEADPLWSEVERAIGRRSKTRN